MQGSFSWKLTKILRFFRRKAIDNYKKNNIYNELRYNVDNFKIIKLNDTVILNVEGWVHNRFKKVDIIYIKIGNRIEILESHINRPDLKILNKNLRKK